MIEIDCELEIGEEVSPSIRRCSSTYHRWQVSEYQDLPSKMTPRQAVFYRNLIRLSEALKSGDLPVDFLIQGVPMYLDHGCIKIAEHAGFILPIRNAESGVVEQIQLAFGVN